MTAVLDRRLLLDINSLEFAYRAPRRQRGLDGSQDGRFRLGPFNFDIYAGDFSSHHWTQRQRQKHPVAPDGRPAAADTRRRQLCRE